MRTNSTRLLMVSALALATLAGCPKGAKLPGGANVPGGGNIPGGGAVPGGLGGESGMVDPNSCGNYAGMEAGRRLQAFLVATQNLDTMARETADVVKQSCLMIGAELGMTEADYGGNDAKTACNAVFARINENLKVSLKARAGLKVKYTPAVCRVDVQASAQAAAECEAKASADIKASCSGTCRGTCEGTCAGKAGTGGTAGQCNGQCQGTCKGSCEGHADVEASAQCKASASVKASADVQCTEPSLEIALDAKLVLDKSRAEMTIKALKAGLPKLLSVKARLDPLQHAAMVWAASARELKDAAPMLAKSFKDQAMCISGQIAAAAKLIGSIEANVSVSVEVSASASGSIGS